MDENTLLKRAQAGDSDAFEMLLTPYQGRLLGTCRRYMINQQDAEDCLQDCMLRVFRYLKRFQGRSGLYTWLYRVAVSTCLDALRARKNNQVSMDGLMELGWLPTGSTEEGPESRYITGERRRYLFEAISKLPDDMRVPVVLRDIDGLSYEEIAETLDLNIGTVKSRISRGRKKLREEILSNGELFHDDLV